MDDFSIFPLSDFTDDLILSMRPQGNDAWQSEEAE
jgi:hypothetical protein